MRLTAPFPGQILSLYDINKWHDTQCFEVQLYHCIMSSVLPIAQNLKQQWYYFRVDIFKTWPKISRVQDMALHAETNACNPSYLTENRSCYLLTFKHNFAIKRYDNNLHNFAKLIQGITTWLHCCFNRQLYPLQHESDFMLCYMSTSRLATEIDNVRSVNRIITRPLQYVKLDRAKPPLSGVMLLQSQSMQAYVNKQDLVCFYFTS